MAKKLVVFYPWLVPGSDPCHHGCAKCSHWEKLAEGIYEDYLNYFCNFSVKLKLVPKKV